MKALFDHLALFALAHLSMKVAFLVAIISARSVGEPEALLAEPPYTIFNRYKVSLRLYPKFTPESNLGISSQTTHLIYLCSS